MRHRKVLSQGLTLVGALAAAACTGRIELPGGVQVETVSSVTEAQAQMTFPLLVLPGDGSSESNPTAVRIVEGPGGARGIQLTYELGAGQASIGQSPAPEDYEATLPTLDPAAAASGQAAAERIAQAAATAPSAVPIGIRVRSRPGFLVGGSYKTMLQWVENGVAVTVDCSCPAPEALRIAGRLRPFAEAAP